jgi:hypothetical protein
MYLDNISMAEKIFANGLIAAKKLQGATFVEDEVYANRLATCRICEYSGTVQPLPLLQIQGCTICNCPFSTKPRFATHFSKKAGGLIETTCPKNKW